MKHVKFLRYIGKILHIGYPYAMIVIMSPENLPLHDENVYSKAKDILNLYGHPGTGPTFVVFPRPNAHPRITMSMDLPITEAPIVPVQIAGNDYRLWLTAENDSQSNNPYRAVLLSVHFQQLPNGLNSIEYDNEGRVTGFWYEQPNEPKLRHVQVVTKPRSLPKELDFSWFCAKNYSINPNSGRVIENILQKNVPSEIAAPLLDSSDFLFGILNEMQTKLEQLPQ